MLFSRRYPKNGIYADARYKTYIYGLRLTLVSRPRTIVGYSNPIERGRGDKQAHSLCFSLITTMAGNVGD
ncbi:hypothetical protein K443DRAFT_171883 [Laccaria amethystina LaAM-08-1]|uniref:Uncharacterized protein n=1 Tax=Laccaria amethystina LaAM-08-1 TaxID=1095629 RepID=A0A0C9XPJ4_9AGAR|nr:hypothetical protein K443DRAFT_171883 [Laccaria amethystina LaAM-08-1]